MANQSSHATLRPTQVLGGMKQEAGFFHRWRVRLFGERDAVEEQLEDIARQGSSMARVAHVCALALIILFSLGSLAALSGDGLSAIVEQWRTGAGVNIPAAISVAVSTLLVLCMDVGMVYAASMLRLLNARRAEAAEKRLHEAVMLIVAVLEAGTYAYMSARYEHPGSWVVWVLILARAGAAPMLSIYLSMARPLPVASRDILYQAELASGKGVIRDVVTVANDVAAPLDDKMALYGASAVMTTHDRARLDGMIAAVQRRQTPQISGVDADTATEAKKPTSTARVKEDTTAKGASIIRLTTKRPRPQAQSPIEQRIRKALKRDSTLGKRQLARLVGCSESTASRWKARIEAASMETVAH